MSERFRGLLGLLGLAAAAVLAVSLAIALLTRLSNRKDTIVIASKSFSESWVLAEIYAQRIERVTGDSVRRRHALGGTLLAFEALRNGAIDLYPEYTGTGLVSILGEPVPANPRTVLPRVRRAFESRWGLTWLSPQAFNNTYAIAMTREAAERLGITRVSDLREHTTLRAGFATEFAVRADGWPGVAERYDLSLDSEPLAMEAGLMYRAAAEGDVDIISAYATDARVDKFDLVLLSDDRAFFPPYRAAPVLAPGFADERPDVVEALAPLAARLTDTEMRRLNGEVDIGKRDPAEVAAEYLDSQGL